MIVFDGQILKLKSLRTELIQIKNEQLFNAYSAKLQDHLGRACDNSNYKLEEKVSKFIGMYSNSSIDLKDLDWDIFNVDQFEFNPNELMKSMDDYFLEIQSLGLLVLIQVAKLSKSHHLMKQDMTKKTTIIDQLSKDKSIRELEICRLQKDNEDMARRILFGELLNHIKAIGVHKYGKNVFKMTRLSSKKPELVQKAEKQLGDLHSYLNGLPGVSLNISKKSLINYMKMKQERNADCHFDDYEEEDVTLFCDSKNLELTPQEVKDASELVTFISNLNIGGRFVGHFTIKDQVHIQNYYEKQQN